MSFRRHLLHIHRWTALLLAGFVALAGLTGSFLAFHHELDALLAPELHRVAPATSARASLDDVARRVEERYPNLAVAYFVFTPDPSASIRAVMNTRAAADAGRLDRDAAEPSEVFADPYSGQLLGERVWGEIGGTRAHVVPMIYRLHTSLFLDATGRWLMVAVAATWIITLLAGAVIALPRLRSLASALRVKWHAGTARAMFDLHRSVGIAAVLLLGIAAITGLYMNLPASVIESAHAWLAPFTPRPKTLRSPNTQRSEVWRIGWDAAYARAREAQPAYHLAVFARVESRGYYQLRFMPPGDIVDAGTIRLFIDGRDGKLLGRFHDREGTAGDVFRIWQFPLHSGQAFGLAGRALVFVLGFVPIVLASTGVWLWLRRRRSRRELAN